VMARIIRPELIKILRHYILKSAQQGINRLLFLPENKENMRKVRRLRAGLTGALHYYLSRFGNCPKWLSRM
jgi:hypothetical protein